MTVETFTYAGAELVWESFGNPEARGTAIVIHGIGLGRTTYEAFAECLARDVRVITLDLPGFGDAAEPPGTPTIERLSDLVAALIRSEGWTGVTAVGHSMGSQVAVSLADRHPTLVDRLVLVGPTVDSAARSFPRQLGRLALDAVRSHPLTWVRAGREYFRAGPNLRRKVHATIAHRPEDIYPKLQLPVLVLRGEHDLLVRRKWSRQVVEALPNGQLQEFPGRGHATIISDPEEPVAAIHDFVATEI